MIGIIDYGLGNIKAFSNILKNLNYQYIILSEKIELEKCSKFILPGVGAFDEAVLKIKKLNYFKKLENEILVKKKNILGICVGMQVFLEKSEEGLNEGLNWVNGTVVKFSSNDQRIPHMGWNKLIVKNNHDILKDISKSEFYFLHSYYCKIRNDKNICTYTNYEENFCSVFVDNNIFGIQFHPEKSHSNGIQLIKNFASIK